MTVLTCWSVEEAHLARIHLANEGIESHLHDDQTVAMDWGLANAIRGVRLVVKQADADEAREILKAKETDNTSTTNSQTHEGLDQADIEFTQSDEVEDGDDEDDDHDTGGPTGILTAFSGLKYLIVLFLLSPLILIVVVNLLDFLFR